MVHLWSLMPCQPRRYPYIKYSRLPKASGWTLFGETTMKNTDSMEWTLYSESFPWCWILEKSSNLWGVLLWRGLLESKSWWRHNMSRKGHIFSVCAPSQNVYFSSCFSFLPQFDKKAIVREKVRRTLITSSISKSNWCMTSPQTKCVVQDNETIYGLPTLESHSKAPTISYWSRTTIQQQHVWIHTTPMMPFSLCKWTVTPFGTKMGHNVGIPMPRFTETCCLL